ncbi:MAG: PAS domain S-box protein [Deltaproteobacteria bacterium]|nr:PAS domain S-box protein [Deltaproteobacteria bacterium]
MLSENIILQSAGSLSVAVMALLMVVLQSLFFFKKPQFKWYAWSAAVSFSCLLYSVGVFIEYNTPPGPLNRFSGLLELTAIICLIHSLYGFTFSYLGIESKRYHPIAGVCHGLILILLWSTNFIVSESFTTRDFFGLKSPYIEPSLGPIGPAFVLYAVIAGMIGMTFWIKHKWTDPKHRIIFMAGGGFWLLLGIHDGLAALGLPTLQYFMEYGFLGFAMVVLWVVFNSYLEIAAEDKYRVITEFANDGIMVIQDGKMVFENPACCDLIGPLLTDSGPRDFLDIMALEDRKTVLEHCHILQESGHAPNPYTVRIRRTDRERRFVEIASSLIQYRNKPAVLAIMRDMTERKQAEETRESEERLRLILDSIQAGVIIIDVETRTIVDANPAATKTIGVPKEQIIGQVCHNYFCPAEKGACPIIDLRQKVENTERTLIKANGEEVPILKTVTPILLDNKECFLESFLELTEKKRLEVQLQQAQKMEAIGTLAGGVAHDLNNILGGIVSYPELLLLKLPEDSPLRKSIQIIQKSGEKAAAVVQDLLTLARRGVVITEVVSLNDIISEYLKSPEHEKLQSFYPGVHLETHLDQNILNILGSPTHLSKTIMNLVSNAAEAMPEGGELSVSVENRYIDRPIRDYNHVKEGDYVVLIVSDTGTGISPDEIGKIFEPFYTKKKMGRSGTGLGMAVVWGTVKDHNGYIHVQSTEGKGTTFTLYFPVTRKSLEERPEISLRDFMGKDETILVVDDLDEQRKIASGMLKELGYSVVSVPSGEEAVEYLATSKVDLLLLDMIMDPGMDGLDTYKKILQIHPEQKAIITSGFSETDRVKEVQSLGAGAYIRKPLLLEKVGLAVKEELEK